MKRHADILFYVSVGAGMALATSVFTMIGGLFAVASLPWIVTGIALAGLFCGAISLSIGELASLYPSAPGIRTYFKAAFGEFPSLVAIYLYLAFAIIVAGLESFVFASVVGMVAPDWPKQATVLVLLLVVVGTNLAGFQLPRGLQIGSTVGAVGLVLVAAIWALVSMGSAPHLPPAPVAGSLAQLPALIGMSIFLFTGFEWVTPLGLKPSAYKMQIPVSMLLGLLVLTLTYALFTLGAAAQVPATTLAGALAPQMALFRQLYGDIGLYVGLALSVLAIFSTFNAGILGGAQLIYLLGREGALPSWLAVMSPRTATPTGAILTLGSLASVSAIIVLTFRLEITAALIGATIMCAVYSGFVACGLRLKNKPAAPGRRFTNPLPAWAQILLVPVLLIVGVQTLFSEPKTTVSALVGLGVVLTIACLLAVYSTSLRGGERGAPAAAPRRAE
jgi:ethanolamine permease